jgi:hypothetical protein
MLNKVALSLYKLLQPVLEGKKSIRSIRKCFGWDYEDYLSILLSLFDDDFLYDLISKSVSAKK